MRSEAPELLLASSVTGTPAGASYLLRMLALKACLHAAGVSVLLLQRHESDLFRDHVAAEPSGILGLVREMQSHGVATVLPGEVRFHHAEGDSVLRWSGCSRESDATRLAEQRVDVLLLDHAEEVPELLFERLRAAALASPNPARRVVAAARSATEAGWVSRHWSVNGSSGRAVAFLDPGDLDPELVRRPSFPSYREWLERNFAGEFIWAPHTSVIVDALNRWIDSQEFDHLAIFVPSQHGKTQAGPRDGIPYILRRFPSDWCAVISYNGEIANSRSADARANFVRIGGEVQLGRDKVKEWKTLGGGGCWSAGMGAGQTGQSSSWIFLDDPDQDWADAVNRVKQEKKRRRYSSVVRARESMFAAGGRIQRVCVTATRWDPGDLVGHAMDLSHAALVANPEARGERWGILAIPAVCDPAVQEGYRQLYPRFLVFDDFRAEKGEPIWPARRNASDWATVMRMRGPIIAACECQQSPRGVEKGGQFEADWFDPIRRDPAYAGSGTVEEVYAACTRAWDLAATEGGGDWTVGAKVGRTEEGGDIVVRHVARGRYGPLGVKHLIAACMIVDGPRVKIRIPIDPAAGGESWADELVRYLRQVASWCGIPVPEIVCKRPRKAATASLPAKAARARDFKSRAQPPAEGMKGGVKYVKDPWEPALSHVVPDFSRRMGEHPELREIAAMAAVLTGEPGGDWWTFWLQVFQGFTGDEGRVDDDVDATVDAYEEVAEEEGGKLFVV